MISQLSFIITFILLIWGLTILFNQLTSEQMEPTSIKDKDILAKRIIPELPKKMKIGYANWGECDEKIFEAVQNGLNTIIWFSVDLSSNPQTHRPEITRGPNYQDVAKMIKRFRDNGYNIINLLSIGGWNTPHPDTAHSGKEYFEAWLELNRKISNEELEFYGFDGFDWDIEGNDDFKSTHNHFTFAELDVMGEMSKLAKEKGYIISMAPAESYLDTTTNAFSLSLLHNHPEWEKEVPKFTYHGRNAYAYLLAKYGVDTFDFISVQLYEGYSHTLYMYSREKKDFGSILAKYINAYESGYEVDFTMEKGSGLEKVLIKIPKEKIVIGLANAWATKQFIFIDEDSILQGYKDLKKGGLDCRGFMYWDIADEGKIHPDDKEKKEFYMSKVLNKLFE